MSAVHDEKSCKKSCQQQEEVPNCNGTVFMAFGAAQIVFGVAIIVTQVCATIGKSALANSSCGYWTGGIMIAAGANGIAAGIKKTARSIRTFLSLSGVAAVFGCIVTIIYAVSLYLNHTTKFMCVNNICVKNLQRDAIDACLVLFGLCEVVTAVLSIVVAYRQRKKCGTNGGGNQSV